MRTTSAEHWQNMSYCGLIDTKIRASDKDFPILSNSLQVIFHELYINLHPLMIE